MRVEPCMGGAVIGQDLSFPSLNELMSWQYKSCELIKFSCAAVKMRETPSRQRCGSAAR